MNSPVRVIGFVNAAHFIDHYSMLIFAAAVIVMGPALGMAYSELLPYATPGFIAFGAGSLLTGWLGDRWGRRCSSAPRCYRSACSPRSIIRSAPP